MNKKHCSFCPHTVHTLDLYKESDLQKHCLSI